MADIIVALDLGNFDIPESNAQAAMEGFLASTPNDRTIPDPENPDQRIPEYTDEEWVQYCIRQFVNKTCRRGWDIIRDRDAVIIDDVFVE